MHDNHKHHSHGHNQDHVSPEIETLRKLQAVLEHWIDHNDGHDATYEEWAAKAHEAGEEDVSKEIYLAVTANATVMNHLKRARAILSAKLVLRR